MTLREKGEDVVHYFGFELPPMWTRASVTMMAMPSRLRRTAASTESKKRRDDGLYLPRLGGHEARYGRDPLQ